MKNNWVSRIGLITLFLIFWSGFVFALEGSFSVKMIARLNSAVRNCNGHGMDPKPGMLEFVKYLSTHGYPGVKVVCGISNYRDPSPVMIFQLSDGGEIFVNFKKTKTSLRVQDIVQDVMTPEGMKRRVLYTSEK